MSNISCVFSCIVCSNVFDKLISIIVKVLQQQQAIRTNLNSHLGANHEYLLPKSKSGNTR